MKIKLIRIAKFICFCALVLATLNYLTKLFTPKWLENRWQSAKTNNSFYELEDNSIDVAVMGSSVVAAAVDPFQLYEEYGISAYNMGVMQQPMAGTYFWIEEMLNTQKPKVMIIEIKTAGRVTAKNEADSRKSYDYMRWGLTKVKYAFEYCNTNKEADIMEYLFPLGKYHSRWSELSADDYDFVAGNDDSLTRGFATLTTLSGIEFKGVNSDSDKEAEYNATNEKYLVRIIDLCKENNVEVVLLKTPDTSWSASRYNHVSELAKKHDVTYIDMCTKEMIEQIGIDYANDGADTVHLNLNGARKVTSYLGKFLSKNYDLTDYRNDKNSSIEEEYKVYKSVYADAQLCMDNNIDEFLTKTAEKVESGEYAVAIVSPYAYNGKFSEKQTGLLKRIGVPDKFFADVAEENNIIVVMDGKEVYYDSASNFDAENEINTEITKDGVLSDEETYSIRAKMGDIKIQIGNKDVVAEKYHVNIAVYNKNTGEVADCIYLGAGDAGVVTFGRKSN